MRDRVLALLVAIVGCQAPFLAEEQEREPFEEVIRPLVVAACASEFFCEHRHWPHGIGELRGYSTAPDHCTKEPIQRETWVLLEKARVTQDDSGSLTIRIDRALGEVSELPTDRPVEFTLTIQEPGCWPP
jgi:hypothetical protein